MSITAPTGTEPSTSLVLQIAQAMDDAADRFYSDADPGTDDEGMYVARALISPGGPLWSALHALGTLEREESGWFKHLGVSPAVAEAATALVERP